MSNENTHEDQNILEQVGDAVSGAVAKVGQLGTALKTGFHDGREEN